MVGFSKKAKSGAETVQKRCKNGSRLGTSKHTYPGFQPVAVDCIFIIVIVFEPTRSSPSPLTTANRSARNWRGVRKLLTQNELHRHGPVRHRSAGKRTRSAEFIPQPIDRSAGER